MELLTIFLFIGILTLVAIASLMWGCDSRTHDDTLHRW